MFYGSSGSKDERCFLTSFALSPSNRVSKFWILHFLSRVLYKSRAGRVVHSGTFSFIQRAELRKKNISSNDIKNSRTETFFIDEEFLAFLIKLPFKTSIAWFGIWWISGKKMERFNLKCGLRLVGYSWVEVGLGWDTPLVINLRWFHRNSGKFLRESIWGDRLTKFELYLSCTLFWPSEKLKRVWYIVGT